MSKYLYFISFLVVSASLLGCSKNESVDGAKKGNQANYPTSPQRSNWDYQPTRGRRKVGARPPQKSPVKNRNYRIQNLSDAPPGLLDTWPGETDGEKIATLEQAFAHPTKVYKTYPDDKVSIFNIIKDGAGRSPLHWAACSFNVFTLERIFRYPEVDPNQGSSLFHNTPLNEAIKEAGRIRLFISKGEGSSSLSEEAQKAKRSEVKKVVERLMEHKDIDYSKTDSLFRSPFHWLVEFGAWELMDPFIAKIKQEQGFGSIQMKDDEKNTPWHIAVQNAANLEMKYERTGRTHDKENLTRARIVLKKIYKHFIEPRQFHYQENKNGKKPEDFIIGLEYTSLKDFVYERKKKQGIWDSYFSWIPFGH